MTVTSAEPREPTVTDDRSASRVPFSDPRYGEIHDFLIDEAALLDDDDLQSWLALLTEDATYCIPTRKNVHRKDGRGHDEKDAHMADNLLGLAMKVKRSVEIGSAWDRDPAPLVRRLVGNVVVSTTGEPDELAVASSVIVVLNRFSSASSELLSARRHDVIRRTDAGLRLARRVVLIDQGRFSVSWINIFL